MTLLPCVSASAQFNINRRIPKSDLRPKVDTALVREGEIRNEFINYAYVDAERRRIRNERNTLEFNATLQVSQTQFENWAQGGDNTFSGRSTMFFNYLYKRSKFSAGAKVEVRYGLNYIEKKRYKNEDEFKVTVISGLEMSENWSYAVTGTLRSQFATSYKSRTDNTRKSTFMAPGFLDISAGLMYNRKPFSVVLSPIAGSAVFVLDEELRQLGMNGVDKGRRSKWQAGPSVKAELDWEFLKKVCRLRSSLYSFTNIKTPPTVRWENTLEIRATKFLTTTLYGLMQYDKYADTPKPDQIQYKYSLSVGLSYTFKNK